MTARGQDLTQGPIGRTLIVFALPVLGTNVLQSLNGSINALWIGNLLGEAELTATSNANLILFLLLSAVFGVGMAATILIGQRMGARDLAGAKEAVGAGAAFFVGVSALVSILGYAFTGDILRLLDTPAPALPAAKAYLQVIFIALPVMNFLTFVGMTLRGGGDSRTPFLIMGIAVALDVALNPLLILGLGPFPRLGIAGSAWATAVSQLIACAALLGIIYRRRHPLRLTRGDLHLLKPNLGLLRIIVAKGMPMGLQMIVISLAGLVMMGLVNGYGVRNAAAYGVALQVWSYIQMPALAVGAAVSSMAAQNIGAGRWDRVSRLAIVGSVYNAAMSVALVLLVLLLARPLMGAFLPGDGAAVDIAVHINEIAIWSFTPFSITFTLFSIVRANGSVNAPLAMLFVSLFVVRLPFVWALDDSLGADAIYWSFPLGSAVLLAMTAAHYLHGGWRSARMDDRPQGDAPVAGQAVPTVDA